MLTDSLRNSERSQLAPVDDEKCKRMGEILSEILPNFLSNPDLMPEYRISEDLKKLPNFKCMLFFTVLIDYGLEGYGYGDLRGADLLWEKSRELLRSDPYWFESTSLASNRQKIEETLFSRYGLPNVSERAHIISTAAQRILALGGLEGLYARGEHDAEKIMGLLRQIIGEKTKRIFLFMRIFYDYFWKDLTNLKAIKVAPDYHLMKVALRTGILKKSADYITTQKWTIIAFDGVVDFTVGAKFAGQIDEVVWNVGRTCCSRFPACENCQKPECKLGTVVNCSGKCIFASLKCDRKARPPSWR